jgi:hypothetical protein
MLGSVSTEVSHHAHCPIVIVPAGAGEQDPGSDRLAPGGG